MTTTHRAPSRRARVFAAALAAAALVLATVAYLAPASAAPGEPGRTVSCTTDADGYCTVNHGLGVPPEGVVVTLVEPYRGFTSWDEATSSSFRLHVQRPYQNRPYAGPLMFSFTAWPSPDPGTPSLTPTSPVTSAPTTSDAVPPPTTTPATTTPAPTSTAPAGACAPVPSSCGYPDGTNTGVPAGTVLTPAGPGDSGPGWHWDTRGWIAIDGDGAVLDAKLVTADINVFANNVTISNSRIRHSGFDYDIALRHTTGVKIVHNSIGGLDKTGQRCDNAVRGIYGDDDGVTITGNDISYCASAVNHLDRGGLVADNWFHDFGFAGDDHVNGIQLGSGTGPLMVIRHNTIFNEYPQTDAVMLANDDGSQTNRTVTDNLLAGGGYTFYGSGGPAGIATDIRFTDNRFSRKYYPQSGYWGPVAYWKASGAGNVFSGNVWDETGASVSP